MGKSNLDSFLDAITPSVQCQYVSKSRLNDAPYDGCDEALPFFNLSDLWSSYDEWSAYGAGVSLRLPKGESVTQYYVPYLSAMQIYLRSGWNVCTYKRSLSEESDWSDVSDMRDTSSDYGTDNESDKAPSRWDGSSCPSSERNSSPSSKRNDQLGDLVFEYFERAPPYNRSPLVEKVRELETVSPHTLALNNHQLSPASWFAVAWYPILRIPTGSTMCDLATCFLTYHSLWTPCCVHDESVGSHQEIDVAPLCFCDQTGNFYSINLDHTGRKGQDLLHRRHSSWRMKNKEALEIPAFALACYKLRDPFWKSSTPEDKQHLFSLATSADGWLRQLGVNHPDFNFFLSREGRRMYGQ